MKIRLFIILLVCLGLMPIMANAVQNNGVGSSRNNITKSTDTNSKSMDGRTIIFKVKNKTHSDFTKISVLSNNNTVIHEGSFNCTANQSGVVGEKHTCKTKKINQPGNDTLPWIVKFTGVNGKLVYVTYVLNYSGRKVSIRADYNRMGMYVFRQIQSFEKNKSFEDLSGKLSRLFMKENPQTYKATDMYKELGKRYEWVIEGKITEQEFIKELSFKLNNLSARVSPEKISGSSTSLVSEHEVQR
jgi:hypothetical protein